MHIIPFVNHKGGVGKTTCVINFGAILAALNYRVLLIDLDPQGNLASGIKFDNENLKSIYDVLMNKEIINKVIRSTYLPKIDVISSSIDLAGIDYDAMQYNYDIYNLRNILRTLETKYDYILIDVPPSLGFTMVSAILASTEIIIPLQCEFFALNGLINLIKIIKQLELKYDQPVRILGILISMVDQRSKIVKELLSKIRTSIPLPQFKNFLPRNTKIIESNSAGIPIILYDLNCSVAQAYLKVTKEMLDLFYKAA